MADSTIALDALESLEVQAELASKIAFDHILSVLDRVDDLGKLLFVQVLGAKAGIDGSRLSSVSEVSESAKRSMPVRRGS